MTNQVPQVDCTETVAWLYEFLDGELTEERRIAVREPSQLLSAVRQRGVVRVRLRRVIADRCRDHVPDQLRERIQAAIAELGKQATD